MLRVAIITGSTRPGRKSEVIARWVHAIAASRTDAEFQVVDIKEYGLPLLDEPAPPMMGQYSKDHTKASQAPTTGMPRHPPGRELPGEPRVDAVQSSALARPDALDAWVPDADAAVTDPAARQVPARLVELGDALENLTAVGTSELHAHRVALGRSHLLQRARA